jgi:hypothetical protein
MSRYDWLALDFICQRWLDDLEAPLHVPRPRPTGICEGMVNDTKKAFVSEDWCKGSLGDLPASLFSGVITV